MTIGERIKKLRTEKGITQSALAGKDITRNMLSLIESGSASPSLRTIEMLARELEVPASYLLSDSGQPASSFSKLSNIDKVKSAFKKGNYAECLSLTAGVGDKCDDEIALILSKCYVSLGADEYHNGNITRAAEMMHIAITYSKKTAYTDVTVLRNAERYIEMIDAIKNKRPYSEVNSPSSDDLTARCDSDAAYLSIVTDGQSKHTTSDNLYVPHLNVRKLIKNSEFDKARAELDELIADYTDNTLLSYFLLCEKESLAKITGDFMAACDVSPLRREAFDKLTK